MNVGTIGILGVGAVGGSIGLRARRNGLRVLGADVNDSALTQAFAAGAIDARAGADEMAGQVETYVIAAHLEPTLREIERLRGGAVKGPALIIDVSSVKVPVAQAAAGLRNFVATHPMAGTERSGISAARPDLFEGRPWAYVPSGDRELDERAGSFIETMGAVPFAILADEHDLAVALSSHVPQLVASCYAEIVASSDTVARQLRGPVACELLRISGMSFDMWRDVFQANAGNIERPLRFLGRELQRVADALAEDDIESIRPLFG